MTGTNGIETITFDHGGDGIRAVIDTARASTEPVKIEEGARYVVHTPDGFGVVDNDLDQYRIGPRRAKGTVTVRDAASLIYLAQADDTFPVLVYADPVGRAVTAVLNEHTADFPGWRDHRVTLGLSPTPQWQRWAAQDQKMLAQTAFAEHLEDCSEDIADPNAATLLEIVTSIEGTTNAEFKNAVRLANGQRQFQYVETTSASAGQAGTLEIPETFRLGLTPWSGGDRPYAVTARLRYRFAADGLRLGYRLVDPDRILDAAFEDVLTPIREAGLTVILGTP